MRTWSSETGIYYSKSISLVPGAKSKSLLVEGRERDRFNGQIYMVVAQVQKVSAGFVNRSLRPGKQ